MEKVGGQETLGMRNQERQREEENGRETALGSMSQWDRERVGGPGGRPACTSRCWTQPAPNRPADKDIGLTS